MQFPETLTTIIKEAAAAYQSDIDKAVDFAFREWKKDKQYGEWVEAMVRDCIRGKVHDARHHTTETIKRNLGAYGQPPKIKLSKDVTECAMQSVLDTYGIAGRALGDLFGKELRGIAATEQEKANGSARNARLLLMLAPIVPAEKTVRQAVSEKRARQLIKQSATNKPPKPAKVKAA